LTFPLGEMGDRKKAQSPSQKRNSERDSQESTVKKRTLAERRTLRKKTFSHEKPRRNRERKKGSNEKNWN